MNYFIKICLLLAITLLSCSTPVFAQQATQIDSVIILLKASKTGHHVDTSLFKQAFRNYEELRLDDEGFRRLNNVALEFKGIQHDDYYFLIKYLAFICNLRPETYFSEITYGQKLLAEVEGRKTPIQKECYINTLANLRLPYRLSSKILEGYHLYNNYLSQAVAKNDSNVITVCYYVLSGFYSSLGLYDKAMYQMKKSITYLSDKKTEWNHYFNEPYLGKAAYVNHTSVLGDYYATLGDYKTSLLYSKMAIDTMNKYFPDGGLRSLGGYNEQTIASVKLIQHDTAGVMALIQSGMAKSIPAQYLDNIASLFQVLGIYYSLANKPDSAELYFNRCIRFMNEKKLAPRGSAGVNTPRFYLAQLRLSQERPKDAIRLLLEELPLISNSRLEYLRNLEMLADAYEKSGNHAQSMTTYKKYIELQKQLAIDERKNRALSFEIEQQINSLTRDKQLQEDEIERQKLVRNAFVGGFAAMLLFAAIFFFQRNKISKARKRSDELLLNILPEEVAEELKEKGSAKARQYDEVTVMFTDVKDFTQISEKLSPAELVDEIDACFKAFDHIIAKYNIEKIKTIGDSYMCAGGLPVANTTHATDVVLAALEIQQFMNDHAQERWNANKFFFEIRIGIHSGPVVAGIVGVKKFAYDIWGDTVNIASRMESSGEAGKVNISGSTYELVKSLFLCTPRGKIQAKGKGDIDMYFVEGKRT